MQNNKIAAPLYYQQLEQSLNLNPLLNYVENLYSIPIQSSSDDTDDENGKLSADLGEFSKKAKKKELHSKQDKKSDKQRVYNFSRVGPDREWLQDLLLNDATDSSDDDSVTEEEIRREMKFHLIRKKYRKRFYSNSNDNRQYKYYSTGLLSMFDLYDNPYSCNVKDEPDEDHKQQTSKKRKYNKTGKYKKTTSDVQESAENTATNTVKVEPKPEPRQRMVSPSVQMKNKLKKKALQVQVMTARRRKLWAVMIKKEICKVQRHRTNRCKEIQINLKRIAQHCMKYSRQKAVHSEKSTKEIPSRARRLTREMQAYWKRYDRVERETRRRLEKEAEEQRKMDVEFMEVKRQQRKLNFLITQTELYAHFMSKKLGQSTYEDQIRILSQLDEEKGSRVVATDDYDSETLKKQVQQNVQVAFDAEKLRSSQFEEPPVLDDDVNVNEERPQPSMFKGSLKHYQLKGMNWLANLYDQGINGILADEMGLGKTVQSIAFLCHIAEKYSVWGPFLIISPSSTLHNWQQEMARFVPDFKIVPYWGNPQERKILRQFWNSKGLHTRDASFHVVITSYQLVITDIKYFNRIKWQYLILDEAQAIKSTNSVRWKMLLGFSCRNRLLLSGTPIQNSMAELWALLHFIMPSMFDSHNEFNEWFSKDIESHAENKTSIDEKHLTRLHLILKPFMLRRIKKDVENELSDKIEIMVYCPLTFRQKMLYAALRQKIRIEDLLHSSGSYQSQTITSNLMNLVMQFRKVCNHPELFERREARSPFFMKSPDYVIPNVIFDEGILPRIVPSKQHLLYNMFSIFAIEYIHRSLFPLDNSRKGKSSFNCFSFTRLMDLSPQELNRIALGDLIFRWLYIICQLHRKDLTLYRQQWWEDVGISLLISQTGEILKDYTFTASNGNECVFSFGTETHHCMPETMEHRLLRMRKMNEINSNVFKKSNIDEGESSKTEVSGKITMLPEFPHIIRKPVIFNCHPTYLPAFTYQPCPKVAIRSRELYCSSRRAAWCSFDHKNCTDEIGKDCVWFGSPSAAEEYRHKDSYFHSIQVGGLERLTPPFGWSNILIPDKQTLLSDASKLFVLDGLLKKLKEEGHRVLIFSQMTRMIDLLEEYMWFRKHKYMRLDGSSKISDRRDMVADFQTRSEIFVFLLSTRAGGLGINLTAADTVIFYDSDWNPTVDQQAMDRTHRLGQTKQVTVYRLICKNTIEERMLQRAREKCEIQRMVISGGGAKSDVMKPKEVVSLLLDDEDIEKKYRQKQLERRLAEEKQMENKEQERKRKLKNAAKDTIVEEEASGSLTELGERTDGEIDTQPIETDPTLYSAPGESQTPPKRGRSAKRGRPFSKNLPGRAEAMTNANAVNSLRERAILTRRARGRPRLNRGGPANHSVRYAGRLKSTTTTFNKISPSKQGIPVDPYSDLQIVPSDT
ncbi:chromatin-remodeling ATPase INO80 isoform X2 [Planococcus citri]|uniref:chromatin-remodeling ATPase INO80 isoform X2 n=1 Tax=Planococcus citri TaxID=170843 RepID=UPI0031F81481